MRKALWLAGIPLVGAASSVAIARLAQDTDGRLLLIALILSAFVVCGVVTVLAIRAGKDDGPAFYWGCAAGALTIAFGILPFFVVLALDPGAIS